MPCHLVGYAPHEVMAQASGNLGGTHHYQVIVPRSCLLKDFHSSKTVPELHLHLYPQPS